MPKLIPDLAEQLLETVRRHVAAEGWDAANLRQLARRCRIAVGTVYNYYPDQLALMAAVIGREWAAAEAAIVAGFRPGDPAGNLRGLFERLRGFRGLFGRVWQELPQQGLPASAGATSAYRAGFQAQLTELVGRSLGAADGTGAADRGGMADSREAAAAALARRFIAKAILDWSAESAIEFDDLEPLLARLLPAAFDTGAPGQQAAPSNQPQPQEALHEA
jgi:AcrR family transcriptional regulator